MNRDEHEQLLRQQAERRACGMSQTDWTLLATAAGGEDEDAARAMEQLSARYWPAIFAFVRASGRSIEESSDLTQGFVCDVIIGRQLIATADPSRGRFRSLMLKSLQNYLRQQHRYDTRQKRSHQGRQPVRLENPASVVAVDPGPEPTAEQFNAQWRAMLVRRVLDVVRDECERDGLESHWTVFEFRVARPMLFGDPPAAYGELIERLDLDDESQASNMMITVKRRVARALREEVANTVAEAEEIEDELRQLLGRQESSAWTR